MLRLPGPAKQNVRIYVAAIPKAKRKRKREVDREKQELQESNFKPVRFCDFGVVVCILRQEGTK